MNKDHYISLGVARKLQEAKIKFLNSEKVWARYKIQVKDCFEWSDYYLARRDFRDDLEGTLFSKYVVGLKACPAPSLSEILDRLGGAYGTFGKGTCLKWDLLDNECSFTFTNTRADVAAMMLLKLKEDKDETT